MRDHLPAILIVPVALLFGVGCEQASEPVEQVGTNEPVIYTSFEPVTYLTRRLIGERVMVVCPLPNGADPASWQPDDDTIIAYQAANLIVINGAGFEEWVATASLPDSRVVDSSLPLADELLTYESMTHSHGPGGAHTHEGVDGHTWVDPVSAGLQAGAIAEALRREFPEHADLINANLQALADDLDALDGRWTALAPALRETTLLASHPAYNYVARRYDLPISNLGIEPGDALDDDALESVRHAIEHGDGGRPRIMLWEAEPLEATKRLLSEAFEVRSVVVSPCETSEATGGDWLACMNRGVERLGELLAGR